MPQHSTASVSQCSKISCPRLQKLVSRFNASFDAFLRMVQPSDVSHPTQPPGVIRSDGVMLARREVPDDDKARQAAL